LTASEAITAGAGRRGRVPGPRPRIGVTTYEEPASWSYWREVPAAVVPSAYVESVRAAGGIPYLLPPLAEIAEEAQETIATLHGLVVIGGADVTPDLYGAAPHSAAAGWQETRDAVEIALIRAALDADLPYLGVCRGLQLLNVARGGTLHQHLPDVVGDPLRHRPGLGRYCRHDVEIAPGSRLAELLGERIEVVSCHHQAPDRVGEGLTAVARDGDDGIVEAIEDPERTFCIGVQWHPEEDVDGPGLTLFRSLVEHAARRRALRGASTERA
jgi:gamma-glutamyl-gamma-aminobutyrate hydrolase PuuD